MMKTLEELKQFSKTVLMDDLVSLEKKRKAILKKILIGIGVVFLIGLIIAAVLMSQGAGLEPLPFVGVGCIIISGIIGYQLTRGYRAEFKMLIINKLIKFFDENLNYYPYRYVPKTTFMLSQIFQTKPNKYKGDDLVKGRLGKTDIQFSELHAEYESGSGKDKSTRTVFKGIFFIADFNKHFRGETVVLPDTAEKLFGQFGKMLQSWNKLRGQLIKLEDPEFEKYFVVYGDDQIEARYILSPSLMARIVDFREKTGQKIYLSFVGSMVFVAIPYTRNLFEPRIFQTMLDFSQIQEYFEDLQLAISIVDEMDLNTRIWSK